MIRLYTFHRDLAFLLYPGRPVVPAGIESSAEKTMVFMPEGKKPSVTDKDVVFVVSHPNFADVRIGAWENAIELVVKQGRINSSVRAKKWFAKAELEDAFFVFKLSVTAGQWAWKAMKRRTGIYQLYDAVVHGRRVEIIERWFELLEDRPAADLLACLLSFASRAKSGAVTESVWMRGALERARKMCDLSLDAVEPVLLIDDGIPLPVAGLATALKMARCI